MGAGASAQALPVLSEFAEGVQNLNNTIQVWGSTEQGRMFRRQSMIKWGLPDKTGHELYGRALNALKQLHQACLEHNTVDTHCRMLRLTGCSSRQIKNALTLFFQLSAVRAPASVFAGIEQQQDKYRTLDLRYDAFFASVIAEKFDELPGQINMLSWNYDDQFERAYSRYLNAAGDQRVHPEERLGVYSKFSSDSQVWQFDPEKFFIYKINGTATFRKPDGGPWTNASGWQLQTIDDVLSAFYLAEDTTKAQEESVRSHVSFSWDVEDQHPGIWAKVLDALKETETLVVVGYSFPFFNRGIDSELLHAMPKLAQVVIQDRDEAAAKIIAERMRQRIPYDAYWCPNGHHDDIVSGMQEIRFQFHVSDGDFFIPNSFG